MIKKYLYMLSALIPILAFLSNFWSDFSRLKADITEIESNYDKIILKLDSISEKLNHISGIIDEHRRDK